MTLECLFSLIIDKIDKTVLNIVKYSSLESAPRYLKKPSNMFHCKKRDKDIIYEIFRVNISIGLGCELG